MSRPVTSVATALSRRRAAGAAAKLSRTTAYARVAELAVLLCGLVLLATLLGSSGGSRLDRATGTALIMLVLVVGLNVFVGNSGVFSFGHMAFMGIGAYTTVIVTMSPEQKRFQLKDLPQALQTLQLPGFQAAVLSGAVAMACAIVVSLPLMRLSGLTASLATVAVLIAIHAVFQNWERFTRGSAGVILDTESPSLGVLLAWGCAAVVAGILFRQSRMGLRLAASREDEVAARAVGIRVWWERGVAWALSAFLVGVGGSLFAQFSGSLNPDTFYLNITFITIAMLVVGGLTSVSGAVIGTLALTVALELLRWVERGAFIGSWRIPSRPGLSEVGLAVVLLAVMLVRPSGITGGRELSLRRFGLRLGRRPAEPVRADLPAASADSQLLSPSAPPAQTDVTETLPTDPRTRT